MLGTLLAISAPALADEPAGPELVQLGAGIGYAQELYDDWISSSEYVEVRDGVRLAMTVYRPARDGRAVETAYPVLFSFTPYRRQFIGADGHPTGPAESGRSGNRPMTDMTKYGYVVAVADMRGRGASFGVRQAYADATEARDGYDLVEWLGAQPWSDGNVGMWGCSYVGGSQLTTAMLRPPSLKAIFPQAASFDKYRLVRRGGIAGQWNTRYQTNAEDIGVLPVDGDEGGVLALAAHRQHEANGQMLDLITSMPYRDDRDPDTDVDYWGTTSPHHYLEDIRASGVAVYVWANWFDEAVDQSLITYASLRQNGARMIVGDGTHCDTGEIDAFAEHLRFYDHYLKNIDNGLDREPRVRFKVSGAEVARAWHEVQDWPVRTDLQRWHLDARPSGSISETAYDGTLSNGASPVGDVSYRVDYDVGCVVAPRFMPSVGGAPPGEEGRPQPGFWPCVVDRIGATFTTSPFKGPVTLAGAPVLELHLAANKDANIFALLEIVRDGEEPEIISHGRLRTSARRLSDPPYDNLGLPWSSNRRADELPTVANEPMVLRFDLSPTAIVIPADARLRLVLTGADLRQRDLDKTKVVPPPQITFFTGSGKSHIELPIFARDYDD